MLERAVPVRTRWDDCDGNGHVNNAAYLALLRDATARALGGDAALGRLLAADISYRAPLAPEVEATVRVALDEPRDGVRLARYEVHGDRLAATAELRWCGTEERAAPALPAIARDAGGRAFTFRQTVRSYEVGPDGRVRPRALLEWAEHAVYRAALRVGWDVARMRAADFVTLQVGHRLVVGAAATTGDELVVTSRIVEMRRVSGMWHHDVRHADGRLVAADRSRGGFVDLAGRLREPPPDMIAALLRGEPG